MLQPPSFWTNINKSWEEKRLNAGLKSFVQEFSDIRDTIEVIHCILGNGSHWWLCSLSFLSKEFQIRDGLTMYPPEFVHQFEYVFERFLSVSLKGWKRVRSPCPTQRDSNNCGVIALCAMEQLCSKHQVETWSQEKSSKFRMMWLRRMVERHDLATTLMREVGMAPQKNQYAVRNSQVCLTIEYG